MCVTNTYVKPSGLSGCDWNGNGHTGTGLIPWNNTDVC